MKKYIRIKTLRTIKSSDELNKKERKKNTRIISENKKNALNENKKVFYFVYIKCI